MRFTVRKPGEVVSLSSELFNLRSLTSAQPWIWQRVLWTCVMSLDMWLLLTSSTVCSLCLINIQHTLNILRHHISTHWDCYLAKFFILWVVAHVLPLQEHVDFPERGPLALLPVPALPHQVVDLLGAVGGLRQVHLQVVVAVVVSGILNDLLVGQHVIRLVLVEGQHLPQGDGKWPHVALCCKLALLKTKLSVKVC